MHAIKQGFTRKRLPFVVLEDPIGHLAVPDQAVPDDEHPMLLSELYIAVGGPKVVTVRARVDRSPLQHVFGTDGVKLRRDNWVAACVALIGLLLV